MAHRMSLTSSLLLRLAVLGVLLCLMMGGSGVTAGVVPEFPGFTTENNIDYSSCAMDLPNGDGTYLRNSGICTALDCCKTLCLANPSCGSFMFGYHPNGCSPCCWLKVAPEIPCDNNLFPLTIEGVTSYVDVRECAPTGVGATTCTNLNRNCVEVVGDTSTTGTCGACKPGYFDTSSASNTASCTECSSLGFLPPISNTGWNTVTGTQNLPMKFSLGGDYGTTGLIVSGYPRLVRLGCDRRRRLAGSEHIDNDVTNPELPTNSLNYDSASQQYTLGLKVSNYKVSRGACYSVELKLSICPSQVLSFKIKVK